MMTRPSGNLFSPIRSFLSMGRTAKIPLFTFTPLVGMQLLKGRDLEHFALFRTKFGEKSREEEEKRPAHGGIRNLQPSDSWASTKALACHPLALD